MKSLGICTAYGTTDELNYEKAALYNEAQKLYDKVILIDTREVVYKFIQHLKRPIITLNGDDISRLNSLIVRSTKNRQASTALLVHTLRLCNCDIFDPIKRFSVGYASKLLSTVKRFEKGVGSNTFLVFNYNNAIELIGELEEMGYFPLIAKPIAGKQGKGVSLVKDRNDAFMLIKEFFSARVDEDTPLLLQSFEEFVEEYRILVVDGQALAVVKKIKAPEKFVANASQGANFQLINRPDVIEFTLQHVNHEGILGVDVAMNSEGGLRIIEANRAPSWQIFEQATGINVARIIINQAVKRLEQ